MLVLSRYKNESIMIGENIVVKVTDVRGNTVRLGITAPRHIPVHRKEIFKDIHSTNIQSRKTAAIIYS